MKRAVAIAAAVALLAAAIAAGVRWHVHVAEAAATRGWLAALDASIRNVERRVESWKTNHERETALVAALVAQPSGADAAARLERARQLLGARDLWVLDSAGSVRAHAGSAAAPPAAPASTRPALEFVDDGDGVMVVATAPVADAGDGRPGMLVRAGPLDPVLRRILPFPYREYPSSQPVSVFRSGDRAVALRPLQREPGGRDTVLVETAPLASAPPLWRAALSGRGRAGTWPGEAGSVTLAAVVSARDGSFGVVSGIDRDEALAVARHRARAESTVITLLLLALAGVTAAGVQAARTARRRRAAEAAAREMEARLARAELEALRVQLQPHFLFNTLNTVAGLADAEPALARSVVERLSALLRAALRATAETEVELARELEVLDDYLAIQQTRFRGRLHASVAAEPGSERALVPSLILQPLVENAIRHGIAPRAAPGRVEVTARADGGSLVLEVADDGVGLAGERAEGTGLANTRARLDALYAGGHRFTLEPRAAGGTIVRLELPFRTRPRGQVRA
ncbi:MAG TPA: histidine kinase [Longimicrobium sp.]